MKDVTKKVQKDVTEKVSSVTKRVKHLLEDDKVDQSPTDKVSTEEAEEQKKLRTKRGTDKYLVNNVGTKPKRSYDVYDDLRDQKLYKANVKVRDTVARKYIEENYKSKNTGVIVPGQLVMFNYFEPKTKADLEYYDAMPCTIFFGIFNSAEGKRILGFNLHYYPPRIRYQIIERIYEIYKPFYLKSFNEPIKGALSHFDYHWLVEQLERAGLSFGVRMYIPQLCTKVTAIPTEGWARAVFTEGHFKKETREQILNYWTKQFGKKKKRS